MFELCSQHITNISLNCSDKSRTSESFQIASTATNTRFPPQEIHNFHLRKYKMSTLTNINCHHHKYQISTATNTRFPSQQIQHFYWPKYKISTTANTKFSMTQIQTVLTRVGLQRVSKLPPPPQIQHFHLNKYKISTSTNTKLLLTQIQIVTNSNTNCHHHKYKNFHHHKYKISTDPNTKSVFLQISTVKL